MFGSIWNAASKLGKAVYTSFASPAEGEPTNSRLWIGAGLVAAAATTAFCLYRLHQYKQRLNLAEFANLFPKDKNVHILPVVIQSQEGSTLRSALQLAGAGVSLLASTVTFVGVASKPVIEVFGQVASQAARAGGSALLSGATRMLGSLFGSSASERRDNGQREVEAQEARTNTLTTKTGNKEDDFEEWDQLWKDFGVTDSTPGNLKSPDWAEEYQTTPQPLLEKAEIAHFEQHWSAGENPQPPQNGNSHTQSIQFLTQPPTAIPMQEQEETPKQKDPIVQSPAIATSNNSANVQENESDPSSSYSPPPPPNAGAAVSAPIQTQVNQMSVPLPSTTEEVDHRE